MSINIKSLSCSFVKKKQGQKMYIRKKVKIVIRSEDHTVKKNSLSITPE